MEHNGRYESLDYPGYFSVPGFNQLVISADGKIIDIERSFCLLPYTGTHGYVLVYSKAELLVHRLLALTFLPIPNMNVDKLHVNHIDGMKVNNAIGNLEWTTPSENSIHAFKSGLRTDNRPVLVKDLRDDSISRYYSLQECARVFGVNGAYVHGYLSAKNRGKVSQKHYVFIYDGDEWPEMTKCEDGQYLSTGIKAVVAYSSANGEVMVFENSTVAAEHFGHKPATLAMHMFRNDDKPFHGWCFKPRLDPNLFHDIEIVRSNKEKKVWKRTCRKPIPIRVTNMKTGIVDNWNSSEAFAKNLGVTKNTLQKGIYRNGGIWRDYKVDFLTNA